VDLQVAKEAILNVLTVHKEHAILGPGDPLDPLDKPLGQEYGIRINLNCPIEILESTILANCLPGLLEHTSVDPSACVLPPASMEISENISHFFGPIITTQINCYIAVNVESVTGKDADFLGVLLRQQLPFVAWFGDARVTGEDRETKQRGGLPLLEAHPGSGNGASGAVLPHRAILHALSLINPCLEAIVTCEFATL
jgi:hypothetical protein